MVDWVLKITLLHLHLLLTDTASAVSDPLQTNPVSVGSGRGSGGSGGCCGGKGARCGLDPQSPQT